MKEVYFNNLGSQFSISFNIKDLSGKDRAKLFKALGDNLEIFDKLDDKTNEIIGIQTDKAWNGGFDK